MIWTRTQKGASPPDSAGAVQGIPPIRSASPGKTRFYLVLLCSLVTATGLTLLLVKLRAASPLDSSPADSPSKAGAPSSFASAFPGSTTTSSRIFVSPTLKRLALSDSAAATSSVPLPASTTPGAANAKAGVALNVPLDLQNAAWRIRDGAASSADLGEQIAARADGLMVNTPAPTTVLENGQAVRARRHHNTSLTLAAGSVIFCALETAIDSEKSGLVTCVVTGDVVGDDAKQVLVERGTHVLGEYHGEGKLGDARIGIVWNRLRKSDGTTVDLMAEGADAQGRAGIAGNVDNHWLSRIGAAVLVSVIEDSVSAATAPRGNGTTVVLSNTAATGTSMSQRVLDATINAAPTISVNPGTRLDILVARDIDFGDVYANR
jgi:type IV secretion system protein VirB10